MNDLFKTITGGDDTEIGIGTAVIAEGHGDWGLVEELRWTSRGEYALVRFPEAGTDWIDADDLNTAEDQQWRPEGWTA